MNKNYEDLANAIVAQAFDDYAPTCVRIIRIQRRLELAREAYNAAKAECNAAAKKVKKAERRVLRQQDLLISAEYEKQSIEEFFKSEWLNVLTKIDGDYLLQEAMKKAKKSVETLK